MEGSSGCCARRLLGRASGGTSLGGGLFLPVASLLSPAPGTTGCQYPEPYLCQEMGICL